MMFEKKHAPACHVFDGLWGILLIIIWLHVCSKWKCKFAVFAMQIRRVYNAKSPCLLTKYAVFALRYGASGTLAGCNRHDFMGSAGLWMLRGKVA